MFFGCIIFYDGSLHASLGDRTDDNAFEFPGSSYF